MADYTQTTDFSAKDALSTGDPSKKIKGSDIDAELEAIGAAITSKAENATNETISGDWTHSGDVVLAGTNTISGATTFSGSVSGIDLQLLASASAADDEYISLVGVLDDTAYDSYLVRFSNVRADTDSKYLLMQFGTGATPTWVGSTAWQFRYYVLNQSGTSVGVQSSSDFLAITHSAAGNAANRVLNGELKFQSTDLNPTCNHVQVMADTMAIDVNGNIMHNRSFGICTPGAAVTSLRFTYGSYTSHASEKIAQGEFRVYGLRNA